MRMGMAHRSVVCVFVLDFVVVCVYIGYKHISVVVKSCPIPSHPI